MVQTKKQHKNRRKERMVKGFATAFCMNCNKQFYMTLKTQKYCCTECAQHGAYLERKKNRVERQCAVVRCDYCGREFMQRTIKEKRCSAECKKEGHNQYRRSLYGDITKCKYCDKPRLPGNAAATCGSEECKKLHHRSLVDKRNKSLKEGIHVPKKDKENLNEFRIQMGLSPIVSGYNNCLICGKSFFAHNKRNNHICTLCAENPERHILGDEDSHKDAHSFYSPADPRTVDDTLSFAEV